LLIPFVLVVFAGVGADVAAENLPFVTSSSFVSYLASDGLLDEETS